MLINNTKYRQIQYLTCYMQIEHDCLWAKDVLPCGRHSVYSHSFVDVFDPVLNRAHVGVGQSVAVSEVQGNACPRPVALETSNPQVLSGSNTL